MNVTYFQTRKPGPELRIEDAVAASANALFKMPDPECSWAGASLPLGAGSPDLLFVSYRVDLEAASNVCADEYVLSVLREVGALSIEELAARLGSQPHEVQRQVEALKQSGAVVRRGRERFALDKNWCRVFDQVIAVEAKVSDWRGALLQAARNRIFANRSFVALPLKLAERVQAEAGFSELGIGLIAVRDCNDAFVLRESAAFEPVVWSYYYRLALVVARDLGAAQNVIHGRSAHSSSRISRIQVHQKASAKCTKGSVSR